MVYLCAPVGGHLIDAHGGHWVVFQSVQRSNQNVREKVKEQKEQRERKDMVLVVDTAPTGPHLDHGLPSPG